MSSIVKSVGLAYEKKVLDPFAVGDFVDVHVRFREGDKERVQIFTGTVIATNGIKRRDGKMHGDINASFTVRRVAQNSMGVERVFPLHCPSIVKIHVRKESIVRRAKLYYLRDRTGKAARLKERRRVKGKKKKPEKAANPGNSN